jgi:hypothetical protein
MSMTLEEYEACAEQFYRQTGMMAPGKDVAAASPDEHTFEERSAAWKDFIEAWKKERGE